MQRAPRLMSWFIWKLLTLGLILAMAGATRSSYGQTAPWSEPAMLSQTGLSGGWFPDIAVDLAGRIHVVWSSGTTINRQYYDTVMYTYTDDGEQWSVPNDIFSFRNDAGSAATRPALAVDSRNTLHLTYTDYQNIFYSRALPEDAARASAWERTRLMATGGAYFSRVTRHQTRLELVDTVSSGTNYLVRYRRSDDYGETWSAPVAVSSRSAGAAKPQLLIDRQDNLHLVWESGLGGSLGQVTLGTIGYAASYDQGTTWQTPLEFTSPLTPTTGRYLKSPAIGLDREARLVMVWLLMPDDIVYYTLSEDSGRTWSEPQPISSIRGGNHFSVATLGSYAMLTDGAGQLHLVMSGRLAGDKPETGRLLHLTWDGTTWSAPEAIANYNVDAPNWPRLAIRNGNELHVVWYVSRLERQELTGQESSELEIWYSHSQIDAPHIIPTIQPRPTLEATVSSTPDAVVAASPSARPTARSTLVSSDNPISVYREMDYLALTGLSLLPVLGVIILIVLGRQLWRRHP